MFADLFDFFNTAAVFVSGDTCHLEASLSRVYTVKSTSLEVPHDKVVSAMGAVDKVLDRVKNLDITDCKLVHVPHPLRSDDDFLGKYLGVVFNVDSEDPYMVFFDYPRFVWYYVAFMDQWVVLPEA